MKNSEGFTVMEFVIIIAITTVLMSIVLFNFSTFNDKAALSSAGQEMAVEIRKTQVYGVNVKEVGQGTGQFNSAYGIYFNLISPSFYLIFVDTDNNKRYGGSLGSCMGFECVEKIYLQNGVTVSSISSTSCVPGGSPPGIISVSHTTFKRPSTDAIIKLDGSDGYWCDSQQIADVIITLRSPKGQTMKVHIENTGQVYLEQ